MKLSVCIITKNEEKNIADCIISVQKIATQIVILDTGSNDNTLNIAKSLGAEVHSFIWINDFSAARNESLKYATGDWILILDADERIVNADIWLQTISQAGIEIGGILTQMISIKNGGSSKSISTILRLVRNDRRFHFEGIIHEQIVRSVLANGFKLVRSDLEILHLGYDISHKDLEVKYRRNIELIDKWLEANPDDIYIKIHKGKMLVALNRIVEGVKILEDVILELNNDNITKIEILNYLSDALFRVNDYNKSINYAKQSLAINANQIYPNVLLGDFYSKQDNYAVALEYYTAATEKSAIKTEKIVLGELLIPLEQIYWRIGEVYLTMNNLQAAINTFSQGLTINPIDINCLLGAANVAFKLEQFDTAINMLKETYKLHPEQNKILTFIKQVKTEKEIKTIIKKPDLTFYKQSTTCLISVCMIVKDEEEMLAGCLASVEGVADEIIIIDTGSSDRTIEIAEQYGAKVFHYKWNNDFASARNESLKNATGSWILYLDADERLSESQGRSIIRQLLSTASDSIGAYLCTIESDHRKLDNSSEKHTGAYPRLFRNFGYPNIKFIGRVHEQIAPSIIEMKKNIVFSDIVIEHLGYNLSAEEMNKKVKRNYKLLLENINEEPTNGYAWFQLGQTLGQMQLYAEALNATEFAIKCANLSEPVLASATNTLAQLYGRKKNYEKALYWANESLKLVPQQLFGVSLKAHSLLYLGRKKEAEEVFLEALQLFKNKPHNIKVGVDIDVSEEILLKGLAETRNR